MTTKAVRAAILLGEMELEAFQSPNGDYLMPLNEVAESLEMSANSMLELRELNGAKTLYPMGFGVPQGFEVDGYIEPVLMVRLDDVPKYWFLASFHEQDFRSRNLFGLCQLEAMWCACE